MARVAGIRTAGGDLATSVISLVRGNPQLVAVVVLAAAEIQIVAVCIAAHSQSGLSLAAAEGSGKVSACNANTRERLITTSRVA